MCNLYRLKSSAEEARGVVAAMTGALRFPEGVPNFEPRDVRITDPAPIIRADADGGAALVTRRWSWPGPTGKPVYNYRSEGREFVTGRCLIVTDGFYEYTAPPEPAPGQPKAKRKDRWLFTYPDQGVLCIAGLWRDIPELGEAFTMLTTEPGPDIAPFHHRQVAVLERDMWARWLDPSVPASELIGPLPAGTLTVAAAS